MARVSPAWRGAFAGRIAKRIPRMRCIVLMRFTPSPVQSKSQFALVAADAAEQGFGKCVRIVAILQARPSKTSSMSMILMPTNGTISPVKP
jgi:hypothetical protein